MRKKCANKPKKQIVFLIIVFFLVLGFIQYKNIVGSNIDDISIIKSKSILNEIINDTLRKELDEISEDSKDFLIIQLNEQGKIQLVQPDSVRINSFMLGIVDTLENRYRNISPKNIEISYGTLLGSKLLSQLDIKFDLKVLPISVSKMDYKTVFVTKEINQTIYRIYLIIESDVKVLEPFSTSNFKVTNKVMLAEAVIVGDVPETYVKVPKDHILDAV